MSVEIARDELMQCWIQFLVEGFDGFVCAQRVLYRSGGLQKAVSLVSQYWKRSCLTLQ